MNLHPDTTCLSPSEAPAITETMSPEGVGATAEAEGRRAKLSQAGLLIVNADDWGRDEEATQRTFDCLQRGTVSSVSAMVFMQDSERAAGIAQESKVDAGLHLNFTTAFSATQCPEALVERQREIASYLLRHKAAKAIFHPGLARSFEYILAAQMEEFQRLYGTNPDQVDGHHHMHLCANVLWGKLLPTGTIARRNFSFQSSEKGWPNRFYRMLVDRMLARRHRLTDFFFSLPPLEPAERLQRIFSLARQHVVELETHPVNPEEYRFLMGDGISRGIGEVSIASGFVLRGSGTICAEPA